MPKKRAIFILPVLVHFHAVADNIQPIVISPTYVKRPLSDLEAMTAAANIFDYMDWRTSGTRGDVDTIMNDPANGLLRSRHPYFTTSPLITAEERSRVDDHIRYLKRVNDIEEEYPTGFERDMVRDVLYRRNGSTLQEYIKRPKHGDGKGGHLVPELRERLQSTVNGLDDYAASL